MTKVKARRRWRWWLAATALLALTPALAFIAAPLPHDLLDYRPVTSVRILDRDGGLLRELRSRADGRSTPLQTDELPAHVRAAFIAAEDKSFPYHLGLSPTGIARAMPVGERPRWYGKDLSSAAMKAARTCAGSSSVCSGVERPSARLRSSRRRPPSRSRMRTEVTGR